MDTARAGRHLFGPAEQAANISETRGILRPMRLLGCLVLLAACGGEDADVAGDYSIALTNRTNGCMFENWTEGDTATAIPVVITQDASAVTATVNGGAGVVLDLVLGSRVYTGSVDGDHLVLEIFGTRSLMMGGCTYTINSVIDAELSGDALTGRIDYRSATNGSPDCGALEGCLSFQEFNGTRPPS